MAIVRFPVTGKDLQLEAEHFEARFGVPTAHLEQAFTIADEPHETDDFRRWSMIRSALRLRDTPRPQPA